MHCRTDLADARLKRLDKDGLFSALRWLTGSALSLSPLLAIFLLSSLWHSLSVAAFQDDAAVATSRPTAGLNESFQSEMEALALRCDQLQRSDLAEATRRWAQPRDPSRRYLYLIDQQYRDLVPIAPDDETAKFWAKRVRKLREEFSDAIMIQAKLASETKDKSGLITAAELLHWAAYQNPENATVMTVLGRKEKNQKWVDSDWGRIGTPRKARRPERSLNWQAGTYLELNSANFHLLTTAAPEDAVAMLARMEVWRSLWRQFAAPYWVDPKVFHACLENGRPIPEARERKHEMVLFANRAEFLQALAHISGIEKSVGYYDGQLRRSFFYLDSQNENLQSTWIHELAHQLFSETGSRTQQPGETSNTWLAEGIAIYFESLRPLQQPNVPNWGTVDDEVPAAVVGSLWSVGGYDAERLQDARIRWFREGYFVPFAELTARGRRAFQTDMQIVRTYSQAGAMCHFLLDNRSPDYQSATWELLTLLYANRDRADSLETLTQTSSGKLEDQYKNWLAFNAKHADWFELANNNAELALGYSQLRNDQLEKLSCPNLYLLQLSATQIDDQAAHWFGDQHNLQQLFLDKNQISDPAAIAAIKANPKLQDLDLAGTAITDETIRALKDNPILEQLWLTSTGITDASVDILLSMSNLEKLDVRGCQLSEESLQRLAKQINRLQK